MEKRIRESFDKQGLMKTLGAQLESIALGEVSISCGLQDHLTQQRGFFHAGVLASLMDVACGYAALTTMSEGSDVMSTEFKVNFLRPAYQPRILVVGKVLKAGRTLTICEGSIWDEEKEMILAKMMATMIRVSQPD